MKLSGILLMFFFPLAVYAQTDNAELQKMYSEDQRSRMVKNIDWSVLNKKDKERENRVYELIKSGKIVTGKDHYNSAMIFQHGTDTVASSMAVKQMRKAIELDPTINKWLLAAAIDRDLMRRNRPQIYGTQYVKNTGETKWRLHEIDTTKVTDVERRRFGVETLAEQREKLRTMNLIPISDYHLKAKSIKQTIAFIKSEQQKGLSSTYNVSESGLNSFGYELMNGERKTDALAIFTLNTKLYPFSGNAFDSLGECLLALGKQDDGIIAYKKSLLLDPENDNARKVLDGLKKPVTKVE
jgi:tetratricopeptide (TPR) repeat protein